MLDSNKFLVEVNAPSLGWLFVYGFKRGQLFVHGHLLIPLALTSGALIWAMAAIRQWKIARSYTVFV